MSYDILIVDDERDIRDLVAGILQDEGYATRCAENGVVALDQIQQKQPNLVILDVWLGNGERDGLKILETIKKDHPYVPVIMISGHATVETAVIAIKNGAYDFIEKPFTTERLLLVVQRAIEISQLRRENEELRVKSYRSGNIVGSSALINQVRHLITQASQCHSRIIIDGAFGVGRQTVAREIHHKSKQAGGSFFSLNCASIHPAKIDAELFGTEISGLPGDVPRKIGLFEQAHGGTLYIANIDEMPIQNQHRLSKMLQDNVFHRIGGTQPIKSNARVIASCSKSPKDLIASGNLLSELFYRLGVIQISLPLLKDRISDIPELAEHFIYQAAKARQMGHRKISEETMVILQSYDWPGNLQQLRNAMEWVLIMGTSISDHKMVHPDMLPPDIMGGSNLSNGLDSHSSDMILLPLREARESFERTYLWAQIQRFDGNISKTASFIGMERSALHRKLKYLGVVGTAGLVAPIRIYEDDHHNE